MQKYHVLTITGWGMTIGGAVMLLIFRPWHIQGVQFSGKLWLLLACVIVLGTVLSLASFRAGAALWAAWWAASCPPLSRWALW